MKKRKMLWTMTALIAAMGLNGCTFVEDMEQDIEEQLAWVEEVGARTNGESMEDRLVDNIEDMVGDIDIEVEKENTSVSKNVYGMGETIEMECSDSGLMNLTFIDSGVIWESITNKSILYITYVAENVGQTDFEIGNGMFDVYVDDYAVEQTYTIEEDESISWTTLSAGRKVQGKIYVETNPDMVSEIEVECGNVVVVIKGNEESNVSVPVGTVLALEDYISLDQTADAMAETMHSKGINVVYLENYDAYGTEDEKLIIRNSDLGTEITLLPTTSQVFSICGIHANMSLEEANQMLMANGAVDASLPDDTVAWRYVVDGKYYLVMYGAGEAGIEISCFPYIEGMY